MITYPIIVERSVYRGSDPRRLSEHGEYNRDASILEDHVNEQLRTGKTGVFSYSVIAQELGMDRERVKRILYSVGCGDNGFTVAPPEGRSASN